MSAAAVAMKIPAATAMAGAKTNNNQLKAACRCSHAAAKLLPQSCRRRCQAARHCRTAAATAALPLPPPWQCCHQAVAAAAALLPSCHRRCQAACRSQAAAATAAAALPPSCCRQAATAVAKLPATAELPLPPLHCCQKPYSFGLGLTID